MKYSTEVGQMTNYDVIRQILREHSSRENALGITEISKKAGHMGYKIGRNAIEGFMAKMMVKPYETEEECDELIEQFSADMREIYFCKIGLTGRRTRGYWMMEALSDSEWMYLIDNILYSKILTKKEADNLAKRVTLLAGRQLSAFTKYCERMNNQPYIVGDEDVDENVGHIESNVLKQVHLIREAINQGKKVKFNLCVYDYGDQKVRLVPYGKQGKVFPEIPEKYKKDVHRICSPFEIIYSNGRYYMLGADLETERNTYQKYKLYRVDLMQDVSVNRASAMKKKEAGIEELENLFKYRMENPYLYTGKVEKVRIRVDSDQFTQIVDWFSDNIEVIKIGYTENDITYYDIEVEVNLNSFTFWVLQYSGCVEVLPDRNGDSSYRERIKMILKETLKKYEENEK